MEKDMEVHNKLVRSKVIEKLKRKGIEHTAHFAGEMEYEKSLYEKLVEEAQEFRQARTKEELADVQEVVRQLIIHHGWDPAEIEKIRLEKLEKEGGFDQPIILDTCEKKA